MKTYSIKANSINKKWFLIDAKNLVLGRLASIIALYLRGKHKTYFSPHLDCGDNIVVINAEKIFLTGNKMYNKKYYWHTGYPGGIKKSSPINILKNGQPNTIIINAVKRMLSRNPLGRKQIKNFYAYAGPNHPHQAQLPITLNIASLNQKNKRRD